MFNDLTIKDMEAIDKLVSERNKILFKNNIFLCWTFPTNHIHQHQSLSSNYFCIWVGKTGQASLNMVLFGGIWMIPELLRNISNEEIIQICEK